MEFYGSNENTEDDRPSSLYKKEANILTERALTCLNKAFKEISRASNVNCRLKELIILGNTAPRRPVLLAGTA